MRAAAISAMARFVALCDDLLPIALVLLSETEYTVGVIKHVFPGHIVLQFDCTNTLADQLLEKVRVDLELGEGWELVAEVVAPSLQYMWEGPSTA